MTLIADATDYPFATDPNYKAGQDPAGAVSDGLALRCATGPVLDYIESFDAPLTLSATGSGEAIYGDTLDVTDANWLMLEFAYWLQEDAGAFTTNANLGIGLEESADGVTWCPVPLINRAAVLAAATNFRDDTGAGLVPSTTGGFTDNANTNNAPLPEDVPILYPAARTATVDDVTQRVIGFYVGQYAYVRIVFIPTYVEPPDNVVPLLAARVYKAVAP